MSRSGEPEVSAVNGTPTGRRRRLLNDCCAPVSPAAVPLSCTDQRLTAAAALSSRGPRLYGTYFVPHSDIGSVAAAALVAGSVPPPPR